jgi:hypothetical protein
MSAIEIAAAVRAGERSARSVVEEHLRAIDAHEEDLHAFNLVTRDAALAAADVVDASGPGRTGSAGRCADRAQGQPLHDRHPTTCSSRSSTGGSPL